MRPSASRHARPRRSSVAAVAETLEQRRLFTVFTPADSAAFSSALTSAQLGDTIILNAGTNYTGWFTLPVKSSGTGYITIQSSQLAAMPDGVRVSPTDAAKMPRIVSGGNNAPAITAAPGAHNYKLLGLDISGPANNSDLVNLVQFGTTDSTQNTLASMPYNFVVDRCYMHPNAPTAQVRRAIALNSGATDITNCYIAEIHQNGSDSQAIGGSNGSGPYNIINNHLEAASENILFGGSGSYIPNTIPSDIVIRDNHFIKPLSWMGVWDVKNLFELKVGQRISVTHNLFENNWNSAQDGTAIVLKLDQWSASRPWQITQNITFSGNIVRHSANAVALQGRDYTNGSPAGNVKNLVLTNNVFEDINKTPWATWKDVNAIGGNSLYLTQGPQNVTFSHNTIFNSRTTINVDTSNDTYPASGFVYQNNIAANNTYGVWSKYGMGDVTITPYFDQQGGGTFTRNVQMNGPSSKYTGHPGNYFPAAWSNVGFTDQANHNYKLLSTSAYHNVGTDGKDLGPDFTQVYQDFAFTTGSTLNLNFNPAAPLPITLTASGGGADVIATYDQSSITFSGVAAINVTGTPGDDQLIINGVLGPAITFAAGTGNDSVHALSGASAVIASDLSPSQRNVSVTVDPGAALIFNSTQHLAGLAVNGNATLSFGGNKVLVTKSLAVAGRLDLTDGDMVLDYSGAVSPTGTWGGSAYSGVTGLLASGRNGGNWSGNGIISSLTGSGDFKTLGVAESSQVLHISGIQMGVFSGETVDSSAVLVKFTYAGDANLDGKLNVDDYGQIDINVPLSASKWFNGDFNYDGKVNVDDYGILDSNITVQGLPL